LIALRYSKMNLIGFRVTHPCNLSITVGMITQEVEG
jgi:hypothetical protein